MGDRVLFWRDRWIHGFAVADVAPLLQDTVQPRVANTRTVQQALTNGRWQGDCQVTSFMAQLQFVHLCHAITTVERNQDQEDGFTWTCTATGQYSARAIYASLCSGLPRSPMSACVWRSWAPLKCKIFAWLAMQYRLWTSDRRARHGLQDEPSACYTCLQDEDNVDHILSTCGYAREVWFLICDTLHINVQDRLPDDTTLE